MRLKEILHRLKKIVFPSGCVFCGEPVNSESGGFCENCRKEFILERECTCPRCGKKATLCCCPVCYLKNRFFQNEIAVVCRFYNSDHTSEAAKMTRQLILQLKREGNEEIAEILSADPALRVAMLLNRNGEDCREWIVTYVPRNRNNLLKYGFDHGALLAEAIAKRLGCSTVPIFSRSSGEMQKELDAEERYGNAVQGLTIKKDSIIPGGKYIIVDDIITTGATIASASQLLFENGASVVLPVAVAKTMRLNK